MVWDSEVDKERLRETAEAAFRGSLHAKNVEIEFPPAPDFFCVKLQSRDMHALEKVHLEVFPAVRSMAGVKNGE